jgi:hypothetical protein
MAKDQARSNAMTVILQGRLITVRQSDEDAVTAVTCPDGSITVDRQQLPGKRLLRSERRV